MSSPKDCPALQCLQKGGQICGNNCCLDDSPFCFANSGGTNTCVDVVVEASTSTHVFVPSKFAHLKLH